MFTCKTVRKLHHRKLSCCAESWDFSFFGRLCRVRRLCFLCQLHWLKLLWVRLNLLLVFTTVTEHTWAAAGHPEQIKKKISSPWGSDHFKLLAWWLQEMLNQLCKATLQAYGTNCIGCEPGNGYPCTVDTFTSYWGKKKKKKHRRGDGGAHATILTEPQACVNPDLVCARRNNSYSCMILNSRNTTCCLLPEIAPASHHAPVSSSGYYSSTGALVWSIHALFTFWSPTPSAITLVQMDIYLDRGPWQDFFVIFAEGDSENITWVFEPAGETAVQQCKQRNYIPWAQWRRERIPS